MNMDLSTIYGSGAWDERFRQTVALVPGETENRVINLYPEIEYQRFEGFGGAITEAAGHVYARMDAAQRAALMRAYFAPEGMNYRFVRIPIDSCDFSLGQYEGFERVDATILPMLRDARAAAGRDLKLMLSPWSPPARFKTNGSRAGGGRLMPERYGDWAEYLCRYVEGWRERGFEVSMLSLQNEAHAVQTWDSCVFTAEEEKRFLRDFMRPALERHGLSDIEIYLWDHNKERGYEWLRDILDETTDPMVAGLAVHWYSGDHFEALELCRRRWPEKKLIVSESCIEFCKFAEDDASGAALAMAHEIIGDLNHGISAFIDWNLLLDERGGPNYVDNFCLAPYLYDTRAGKLRRQLLADYVGALAAAVAPGSVRVACTRFTQAVETTAWRRPDGALSLVMLNAGGAPQPVCVRLDGREAGAVLLPRSITTATIE